MKKLGLVGGTGPESTLLYYRQFVYEANRRKGSDFFPNLTIESINVYQVLALCERNDYPGLTDYLARAVGNLVAAGAEVVALTGNTPHSVFDALQARVSVPMISIINATCEAASARQLKKVGLLGTRFTMEGTFFRYPLMQRGMQVVIPQPDEVDLIAAKIHHELEKGIMTAETRQAFIAIVERMRVDEGIEAVILGCTELPLLFADAPLPVPGLDTVAVHIDALFKALA